jgi:sigma-B regulation protein RsbU (phosphoserine phosphatase)
MLATALYAVLDIRHLRMQMTCAGHFPPLLLRGEAVTPLECRATIPLLLMEIPSMPCNEYTLVAGDRLLFYTDGVTERENVDGTMYEVRRLAEALREGRAQESQQLLETVAADIARFAGGREPSDDQTLLLASLEF